jgi:predicted RNA-binding protein with PUA-like domain
MSSSSSLSTAAAVAAAPAAAAAAAATAVTRWLLKVEPEPHVVGGLDVGSQPFSLLQARGRLTYEGVRNYAARNTLRDRVQLGQHVFYYHASCKEPAIVGIAAVARAAFPDPAAADAGHPFYDAKHTADAPRWFNIELSPVRALKRPVTLAELRAHAAGSSPLAEMTLLRQSRLSVQPVTDAEWAYVLALEDAPAPAGGGSSTAKTKKAASSSAASEPAAASESAARGGKKAAKPTAAAAPKRQPASAAGDDDGAAAAKKPRKAVK